jgi:hypothetical protein
MPVWPHIPFGGGSADFEGKVGEVAVDFNVNTENTPDGIKPVIKVCLHVEQLFHYMTIQKFMPTRHLCAGGQG